MAYTRFTPEQFTHTIDDTIRAEIQTFLKGLDKLRAVLEHPNVTPRSKMFKFIHEVLDAEAAREKQMREILNQGGVVNTQWQEIMLEVNEALDMVETETTAYNTYLEKNGPKG